MSTSTLKINPVAGYLLVSPKKQEKVTESGIYIPESHEEKPQTGTVLAIGADLITDYGAKKTAPCAVGDTVLYRDWSVKEYKDAGVDYLILKFDDIMAVLK